MSKSIVMVFLSCCIILYAGSCSKKSTGPPPDNTVDTTSHNFVWQVDTLGDLGSTLIDVEIINENNIWAVGAIHFVDTITGNSASYNVVHWDGNEWELIETSENFPQFGHFQTAAIYAFGSDDIWLGSTAPIHWDGQDWQYYSVSEGWVGAFFINDIWGTSASNLYFAGSGGNIVHFDGNQFRNLDTGTDIHLVDIYGSPDGNIIWACGWDNFGQEILLRIVDQQVEVVYNPTVNDPRVLHDSLSGRLTNLWTDNADSIYIMSSRGLYRAANNTSGEATRLWWDNDFPPAFPHKLRGQASNDLFIVGDSNMMIHYNGRSWRYFDELNYNSNLTSVAIKNHTVCAVGRVSAEFSIRAFVLKGVRPSNP